MKTKITFEEYLKKENLAENSIGKRSIVCTLENS